MEIPRRTQGGGGGCPTLSMINHIKQDAAWRQGANWKYFKLSGRKGEAPRTVGRKRAITGAELNSNTVS